jgi:Mpv17 / PMP22 family
VAQSLTAIKTRRKTLPLANEPNRGPLISIELTDLKEKPASLGSLVPTTTTAPPPFDFERLTRFMAYGFLMAPIQFHWFGFLSRTFPVTKTRGNVPALQRVAMDQLIFAPIGLGAFFTFMTVAEGGGRRAILKKFQDVYLPALRANYMVWPAVQILNFRTVPIQFQIPFVSTVGIAWTAYLSLTNSAEEE